MTKPGKDSFTVGLLLALAGAKFFSLKAGALVKLMISEGLDTISLRLLRMVFFVPAYVLLASWFIRRDSVSTNIDRSW